MRTRTFISLFTAAAVTRVSMKSLMEATDIAVYDMASVTEIDLRSLKKATSIDITGVLSIESINLDSLQEATSSISILAENLPELSLPNLTTIQGMALQAACENFTCPPITGASASLIFRMPNLVAEDVDALLIYLASLGDTPGTTLLTGIYIEIPALANRTSASDAALTLLTSNGNTVTADEEG